MKRHMCLFLLCVCCSMVLSISVGCSFSLYNREVRKLKWKCPAWLTMPLGPEQIDCPVNLDVRLPAHLAFYKEKYKLPDWLIYGVVRCVGSEEFIAAGKCRRYILNDKIGQKEVVVDDIWYDVPKELVEKKLSLISDSYSAAANKKEREDIIGSYVKRRYGGYVLVSMNSQEMMQLTGNLLRQSGETEDRMEEFSTDDTERTIPSLEWKENRREFIVTGISEFRYGDPIASFRRAEENAIEELAKGLVLKLSYMQKLYEADGSVQVQEEAQSEEIRLKINGLRVIRRAVDLKGGTCFVTISVFKKGVTRLWD